MNTVAEHTFCACGLEMYPTREGSTVKWCINCDRCQPTEGGVDGYRSPTNRDYIFMKVWRQRILKFFPSGGSL